jgi:hypothetical protein
MCLAMRAEALDAVAVGWLAALPGMFFASSGKTFATIFCGKGDATSAPNLTSRLSRPARQAVLRVGRHSQRLTFLCFVLHHDPQAG